MQVQNGTEHQYRSLREAFKSVIQKEGVKALYTGLAPNLLGSAIAWGVYFQIYNTSKKFVRNLTSNRELPAYFNFLCAASAGVTTSLTTNPIWMIKTRLQLQDVSTSGSHLKYNGALDALIRIVREEGALTLWKGIGPALALVTNGALQFMFYEEFKKLWKKYMLPPVEERAITNLDAEYQLHSLHFLAMGATAKIMSTTITYPLQVFRARMYQRNNLNSSFFNVVKTTLAKQGFRGFYQGYVPHCAKTGIASAFTFFAYENILKFIEKI